MRNFQNLLIISGLQYNRELVSSFPKWSIPKYGTLLKQLILKLKLQEANSTKSLKSIY